MMSSLKHMARILKEAHEIELSKPDFQRLGSILNALDHYGERSDADPEIVDRLMQALRDTVQRNHDSNELGAVLQAVDAYEQHMTHTAKAASLDLSPAGRLDAAMQAGYMLSTLSDAQGASNRWLQAWELVKEMTAPEMITLDDFDSTYNNLTQSIFNWTYDLEMELHNAGIDNPVYHEKTLIYIEEFFALFPGMRKSTDRLLNFSRAQGTALWHLGRIEEAEEVYRQLTKTLPDEGWGYIGWADHYYWLDDDESKDFARAEAIMKRALARPTLNDRADVLTRLVDLYDEWGKEEEVVVTQARLEELLAQSKRRPSFRFSKPKPPETKPARNDPCWCGNGKKYKQCHWREDQKV